MSLSEQELKNEINNEKTGNYILLSSWYGGRTPGYNGIIVNLDTQDVKEYSSSAIFENGKVVSKNEINKIGKLDEQGKIKIREYIKSDNIFQFNKVENLVFDAGTSIEIKFDNIVSNLINCDERYTSNRVKYYDILLDIIKNHISKNTINSNQNVNDNIGDSVNDSENIFDRISGLNFTQLNELKAIKMQQAYNKVNAINLNEDEINNSGFVFWSAKTILENIKYINSKLVNNFSGQLNEEQLNGLKREIELLEKAKYNDINDIKIMLNNLEMKKQSGLSDVDRELMKKYNIDPSIDNVKDLLKAVELKKEEMYKSEQDEKLKLANGKYAGDIETKELYDDLRKRMDDYNTKVANGEKPNVDLSDFANEYINNFHDEKLEKKLNEIDENMKENYNENAETKDLISKINDRLGIDDSNKSINEMIDETDKKLEELNRKEIENNYNIESQSNFYKKKDTDLIWWIENPDMIGEHSFTFDKKKIFNLFKDYPYSLTSEQKEIFDRENPYWANFFKDRK